MNVEGFYHNLNWIERLLVRLRSSIVPYETIIKLIPKKGKILDLGCGWGILANLLTMDSRQRQIIGLDLSFKRIKIARKSVNKNIIFKVRDASRLNFWGYQAIIMVEVLHHLSLNEQNQLLAKISQQIDKKAIFMIFDNDKKPFLNYLLTEVIDRFLNPGEPLYFRSIDELSEILKNLGLQVRQIRFRQFKFRPAVLLICQKRK